MRSRSTKSTSSPVIDLVSVDPGVKQIWVAAWGSGSLVGAHCVPAGDGPGAIRTALGPVTGAKLVIEKPQIYQGQIRGTDQNDLIDLAVRVGWVEAAVDWAEIVEWRPNRWKGQLPKPICNARTRKALTLDESRIYTGASVPRSKIHNLLDAIGIGLVYLGRR